MARTQRHNDIRSSGSHGDGIRITSGGSAAIPAAQHLLEKLLLQQRPTATSNSSDPVGASSSSSPLILFQHSKSARLREIAASSANLAVPTHVPSNNPKQREQLQRQAQAHAALYRRAQLRTPADNAARCLWGGALWIEYLVREMILQRTSAIDNTGSCCLLWIRTTPQPVPTWLPPSVTVLDATHNYTNAWGLQQEKEQQHPLEELLSKILGIFNDTNSSCQAVRLGVVLDSITPLVQLFGWSSTRAFLQRLLHSPECGGNLLVLIPIMTETIPPLGVLQLEDWAHTLLWLSDHTGQGDLHVLRKGIREQESTVREIWEFRLETMTDGERMCLVVGETDPSVMDDDGDEVGHFQELVQEPRITTTAISQTASKIVLKLDEERRNFAPNSTPSQATAQPQNVPKIFLQDDDPEFNDYDEEDPDDDLDI